MDKVVYHYCYNSDSVTQKKNSARLDDRLFIELYILEFYKKHDVYEDYKEDLEYNFIKRFYLNTVFVIFTNFDYIPDIINYLRKTVVRLFPDYKDNYIMKAINKKERRLIEWLDRTDDVTIEELTEYKVKYLDMLRNEMV